MDQPVFSGMVGGVIVDPAQGYTDYVYRTYTDTGIPIKQIVSPKAKEVQLSFSEWYLTKNGGYNSAMQILGVFDVKSPYRPAMCIEAHEIMSVEISTVQQGTCLKQKVIDYFDEVVHFAKPLLHHFFHLLGNFYLPT